MDEAINKALVHYW